ncbi:MAG: alanine--glyoxylate aminotransferase family protein, partial [Phycisphaerae bacterium]|nr:alanine--glyoxylate aminotransferase family protein [Phycisphaerae bacterium]
LNEVGIETIWSRSAILAKATRAAAEALGLKVCSQSPSDSVTAIYLPEGVDDGIRKVLKGKYGCSVAGGQDGWKNRVIRVSHMGYIDLFDTIGMIAALEYALVELGAPVEIGKGVAAATAILKDWK